MYTKVIPAEKVNQSLFGLVKSMASYLSCQVEIRPQVIITTDNPKLIELIEQTLGLPKEQPALVEMKTPAPSMTGKTCKYCGKPPAGPRSDTCGSEECTKKQKKERQDTWLARKNGKGNGVAESAVPLSEHHSPDPGSAQNEPG